MLIALFTYFRARSAAHDLGARVSILLRSAGTERVSIDVDGCTITISGSVESENVRVQTEGRVADVPGVCGIVNLLTIEEEVGGPPASGELRISTEDRGVVLRGQVPSRRMGAVLVAAAGERWGSANVTDELVVDQDLDVSGWPLSFVALLDAVHGRGQDLEIGIGGGKIEVSGSVLSQLEKARVHGAIDAALPGMPIIDSVVVRLPEGSAEELQVRLDSYLEGKPIEFWDEGVELTANGRSVLDGLVAILIDRDDEIEIAGHTDSTNSHAYNLDISQRRAESVRGYLAKKKISRKRMQTIGHGELRPIARNDSEEGRARNRRIEIRVLNTSLLDSR
jgi:OOP family OmpA-OmpF porin